MRTWVNVSPTSSLNLQTSKLPAAFLSPGKKKTFESLAQYVLIAEALGT